MMLDGSRGAAREQPRGHLSRRGRVMETVQAPLIPHEWVAGGVHLGAVVPSKSGIRGEDRGYVLFLCDHVVLELENEL